MEPLKLNIERKHLIGDLLPYNCIAVGCTFNNQPFPDIDSWTHHMLSEHVKFELLVGESCLLCNSNVPGGMEHLLHHVSRHLEEISAAALPHNTTSHIGVETESELSVSSGQSTQAHGFEETPENTDNAHADRRFEQQGFTEDDLREYEQTTLEHNLALRFSARMNNLPRNQKEVKMREHLEKRKVGA